MGEAMNPSKLEYVQNWLGPKTVKGVNPRP